MSEKDHRDIGPPAEGVRLPWEQLPQTMLDAFEFHFGARVHSAITQPGGFSPGVAARITLSDHRRVFAKAVGSTPNPESPKMHRREAAIAAALPQESPVPRLLWAHDDGDWVLLAFEDVDGRHPHLPWRREELDLVLGAIGDLAVSLTPSPIDTDRASERLEPFFNGWKKLKDRRDAGETIQLDGWAAKNLDDLVDWETRCLDALRGDTLLHVDLRADNLLLAGGEVYVLDWPAACIGVIWADLLIFLPSVAMQGGPSCWEIFDSHPLSAGADPQAVTAVLAGLTGYFVERSLLPAPPGLPTLREFQRAHGVQAIRWLRKRWSRKVSR